MKASQHSALHAPRTRAASLDTELPALRPVLVATSFDEGSAIALRRGQALAAILDTTVVVVHAVPAHSWLDKLFTHDRAAEVVAIEQLLSALEATRSWCASVLGAHAEQPSIALKRGRVAASILETAEDVDAALIALGDSQGSSSGFFVEATTATVIHQAACPVLVARSERPNHEIVAATNFMDVRYPALRAAVRWGARLDARVTFVHNVAASEPLATARLFGIAVPAGIVSEERDRVRRRRELDELAQVMGADIETAVETRAVAADAILELARTRDADLVVVGARRRGRMAEMASPGTAVTVARHARRSVLTVPLDERFPCN